MSFRPLLPADTGEKIALETGRELLQFVVDRELSACARCPERWGVYRAFTLRAVTVYRKGVKRGWLKRRELDILQNIKGEVVGAGKEAQA